MHYRYDSHKTLYLSDRAVETLCHPSINFLTINQNLLDLCSCIRIQTYPKLELCCNSHYPSDGSLCYSHACMPDLPNVFNVLLREGSLIDRQ